MSSNLTSELSETSLLALANKVKDPNDLGDILGESSDAEKKPLLNGNGISSEPVKTVALVTNSTALNPMQNDQKQFSVSAQLKNLNYFL
jgi:hypothetical protein